MKKESREIFHKIKIEPFGRRIDAPAGTTIFNAAISKGILLRSDCGEKGTCGKCRVIVDYPGNLTPRTAVEEKILKKRDATHRLACQARITGPLTITVPEKLLLRNEVYGKTGIQGSFPADPAVKRYALTAQEVETAFKTANEAAENKTILSQSEKIAHAMVSKYSKKIPFDAQPFLHRLSNPDIYTGDITLKIHDQKGILSLEQGLDTTSIGMAFDIGTTTIAGYLCDLESGKIIASRAVVNPQRRFGEDVISRIAAISENEEYLAAQQALVAGAMDDLIDDCLNATGFKREKIDEITVVGNTTMEHIFSGFNPHSLGVFPYLPVHRQPILAAAPDLNLKLSANVPVYIFPVISGFLGGDILAAFLGDQSYTRTETTLIIDIGTNGELLLCNGDKIWATSCATGPALEGAQISSGMRASSGAISKVWVEDDTLAYQTIGDGPAAGICGSGIIDALAAMRRAGITCENGSFNPNAKGVACDGNGTGKTYTLPGSDIQVLLKDVRQVQLAKAALFVGIESLINKSGVGHVDRTVLTGAFGARFDWTKAMDIGMLPRSISKGQVMSMENLAGTGSVMALMDKSKRRKIESLAGQICFLDLSTQPDFVMKFAEATRFPTLG